jgi:diaminohydroxyphosphoribosylaminopyrimidine deaminase/5-amino-6-(5-phosphoribosylamino)uracil reductase
MPRRGPAGRPASSRGAVVIALPGADRGKVDLAAMLQDLARREINELHVEAGHKLNGSLFREGLVDELVLYVAPRLLGQGAGIAHLGPTPAMAASTNTGYPFM